MVIFKYFLQLHKVRVTDPLLVLYFDEKSGFVFALELGFEDDLGSVVFVLVAVFDDVVFSRGVLGDEPQFLEPFLPDDSGGLYDLLLDELLGVEGCLLGG